MPRKRRRLPGWAIFWLIVLGGLVGVAAEAAGMVQPWRSLFVAGVLAAVFVPLIRGAVPGGGSFVLKGLTCQGTRPPAKQ